MAISLYQGPSSWAQWPKYLTVADPRMLLLFAGKLRMECKDFAVSRLSREQTGLREHSSALPNVFMRIAGKCCL